MKNNRVLIIEDDPDFAASLVLALQLKKFEVETAGTGGEGAGRSPAFEQAGPECARVGYVRRDGAGCLACVRPAAGIGHHTDLRQAGTHQPVH